MKKFERGENLIAYSMLVPGLIPFLLFNLIPIGWVVYLSFTEYDGFTSPSWTGLDNYAAILKDTMFWEAVGNTFVFALGKLIIEIPLALTLAVILNGRIKGSSWFKAISFIPNITSLAVMGLIFFFLFRPFDGILNGLLQAIGLIREPIDYLGEPITAMISVIAVGIWNGLGMNMVLFLAGLQTISKDVYESSAIDGANPVQQMWYITIPLLGPILKVVMMLAIVFTLRAFDLIKVLTDGGPFGKTDVMFTYVFNYFFSTNYGAQYGYGSALGVVAAIIIVLVSLVYFRLSRRLTAHL